MRLNEEIDTYIRKNITGRSTESCCIKARAFCQWERGLRWTKAC